MRGDRNRAAVARLGEALKRIRRTPSPALVIACIALFVALSGVAYAAATIDSEDIVNG